MSYIDEGFKVSYIGKNEHRNLFIRDKHYGHVAEVFLGYGPGEEKALKERDQIGAMFAAAPDMLAALEAMEAELSRFKKEYSSFYNLISVYPKKQIKQAIKKAKGQ